MSKRQFKSQASSARVGGFGAFASPRLGSTPASILSYVQEAPDYSGISDANVVVAFKNLSKKDSTTKARALEELQAHVAASTVEIEEGFLEAWIKLFPRLSNDGARRVRQLTHVLNGHICARCGKRTARHLPRITGPWLAGTYDGDKAVAKSAQDAMNLVFPSPEKLQGLRRTFHTPILEYCKDAVLNETAETLSDERSVSKEDAEAAYARVVATYLCVIQSFLHALPSEEISKQHGYEDLFADPKLWSFSSHADVATRRVTHRLVQTAVEKHTALVDVNLNAASTAYIYKGLIADQTGSASDYIKVIEALTTKFPGFWTSAYTGKKSAFSRLRHFFKQGSQGGTTAFWDSVLLLLPKIPTQIWPNDYEQAREATLAMRDGVTKKEERFNASSAWPSYFTLLEILSKQLIEEDVNRLVDHCAIPVMRQYLRPSPDTLEWSVSGAKAASLVAEVTMIRNIHIMIERDWPSFVDDLVETAKLSQPEQSKDFAKSQTHVATLGERWADLNREVFKRKTRLPGSSVEALRAANTKLLSECVALLISRDGKPFGAAAVIADILRTCKDDLLYDRTFKTTLDSFVQQNLSKWVFTPSRRHLIRILYSLENESGFSAVLNQVLVTAFNPDRSDNEIVSALKDIFPQNSPRVVIDTARSSRELQDFSKALGLSDHSEESVAFFCNLVKLGVLTEDSTNFSLSALTTLLSTSGTEKAAVSALTQISRVNMAAVQAFVTNASGPSDQLLPSLLRLEQAPDDEVAELATSLSSSLSSALESSTPETKFSVIVLNLEKVTQQSLTIDTLHELAKRLIGPDSSIPNPTDFLPNLDTWAASISAAMRAPLPSLAIMSPLGGAVHVAKARELVASDKVKTDSEGLSQALRISMFISRLMTDINPTVELATDAEVWSKVMSLLFVTTLLAEDNLSILGGNALWSPKRNQEIEPLVLDFVSEANALLTKYWSEWSPGVPSSSSAPSREAAFLEHVDSLVESRGESSTSHYYSALGSARVQSHILETHGHTSEHVKASEELIKGLKTQKDIIKTSSALVAYQLPLAGTKTLNRFCNELITDLTELSTAEPEEEEKALEELIMLNVILSTQHDAVESVAKQRLIFLVKRLIPSLNTGTTVAMTSEICKALSSLLPGMQDMYGEHWAQVVSNLISFWEIMISRPQSSEIPDEGEVLLLYASLRLYSTLQQLSKSEEPNDDLIEALSDEKERISDSLIELLKSESQVFDEAHQPLRLAHGLLARQLNGLPTRLQDSAGLYPCLYSPSRSVSQAAFDMLHQIIPSMQEQVSVDATLDNKKAELPEELLSMLLDTPTLDSLAAMYFDRNMPSELQSYLYSWRLLFDHFNGSSYRVKNDYVETLKDGTWLQGLLGFTFDFLGHSRGRPVDASKFEIKEYIADTEPSPEHDVQWLLVHLYYLTLTHCPSLAKSYFLDIRARQTSLAVESWTAKYISPLIISASLVEVEEWARKSVAEDPDSENMTVRVGMLSKEINVSYVVDEQTMAIKIVLPEAYPLASADVHSVSRVAVREEKWQSWLLNCRGVIMFSNGSITDGLTAWRKNVTGALKGQTECAICYSIISADKQLPTKRCPTCKNLFHSSCLFKWFKTSNASTCPLCRNPFNFN